jgi:hypothetical protein
MEDRVDEDCIAEVRSAEVRPFEVRTDVAVLVTPSVPSIHPLLKERDMFVVRHAGSSTRPPAARHRLAPLLSRTTKQPSCSSMDQGGGKRRLGI